MQGDHIEYENGKLFINGEHYEESYLEDYKEVLINNCTLTEDFTNEKSQSDDVVSYKKSTFRGIKVDFLY